MPVQKYGKYDLMENNRRVLITGAHGGLGSALVNVYKEHGWSVLGVDKDDCRHFNEPFIHCNFSIKDEINDLCAEIAQHYPIHTLICNAAYYHFSPFETICEQQLMDSWMINLVAHFKLLQALSTQESGIKNVVIIGSDQCFEPMDFNIAYAMSKAAMIQMVKSYAAEKQEPHIIAVSPGTLKDTPITLEAAVGLSKFNGLTVEETLESFDAESPTGHCIEPLALAEWIFDLELNPKFPSGHVEFIKSL